MTSSPGRAGCGCLITTVLGFLILAALLMHPLSLRLLGDRLTYRDTIVTSDAIVLPCFPEDRNGEVIMDGFREYWAGNGRQILVEEQRILGFSLSNLVSALAKERGIKEPVIRKIEVDPESCGDPAKLKERIASLGMKKVIVMVPEYASRRFHAVLSDKGDNETAMYLIRPVKVAYFTRERWWRNSKTRSIVARELFGTITAYGAGIIPGKDRGKR